MSVAAVLGIASGPLMGSLADRFDGATVLFLGPMLQARLIAVAPGA